jgi:DNA-directed RNA polymerase specialized sigma24 family protein
MDEDSITFGRMQDLGDCPSVRDVYERCHDRLVVVLYRITGDLDEAQQAVDEAFVRAVASGSRFGQVADPEGWLRAAAIHAHRTRRRRRKDASTPTGRLPGTPLRRPEAVDPEREFNLIEAAGYVRRRRRHAVAGALAAALLVVAAVLTEGQQGSSDPGPPAAPSLVRPYPSPLPTALGKGTYDLTPWGRLARPVARFSVPTGWSAWPGPSRLGGFGGWGPGTVALFRQGPDWRVGLLVAAVIATDGPGCTTRDTSNRSPASLLRALMDVPRLAVMSGPHRVVHAGRPAARLRLRELGRQLACPDAALFQTSHGYIDGGGGGSTFDAQVLDVDGEPLLVWAGWTPRAPHSAVGELRAVVDSLVLGHRGHP